MRGFSTGGDGRMADVALKVAPIACSFFAFFFMAISLSSGLKPNYLEGLALVSFNMSTLGKNLIDVPPNSSQPIGLGCNLPSLTSTSAAVTTSSVSLTSTSAAVTTTSAAVTTTSSTLTGIPATPTQAAFGKGKASGQGNSITADDLRQLISLFSRDSNTQQPLQQPQNNQTCNANASADAMANQALQFTADVLDSAIDSMKTALGVGAYYSLHLGAMCEGGYTPSPFDADAKTDVQSCGTKFSPAQSNLSKTLDAELQIGPVTIKATDFEAVAKIQRAIDLATRVASAMGVLLIISTLSGVAGFVLSAVLLGLELHTRGAEHHRGVMLGALGTMGFAWLTAFIGVIGVTVVGEQVKNKANDKGGKFGVVAASSPALYFLLWVGWLLTTAAFVLLCVVFRRSRRAAGTSPPPTAQEGYGDKNMSTSTVVEEEDPHGFYQEPTSGGRVSPAQERYLEEQMHDVHLGESVHDMYLEAEMRDKYVNDKYMDDKYMDKRFE